MLAVVFDFWFRPQDVGDFFLRTRRDCLVDLERWDGRLTPAGNVVLRGCSKWRDMVNPSVGNNHSEGGFAAEEPGRTALSQAALRKC